MPGCGGRVLGRCSLAGGAQEQSSGAVPCLCAAACWHSDCPPHFIRVLLILDHHPAEQMPGLVARGTVVNNNKIDYKIINEELKCFNPLRYSVHAAAKQKSIVVLWGFFSLPF